MIERNNINSNGEVYEMKKATIMILVILLLIMAACGAADGETTTADSYKADAESTLATTYSSHTSVIYEYTVISSTSVSASFYFSDTEEEVSVYSSTSSYKSKSDYEIEDDYNKNSVSLTTGSDGDANYLEFMIAYTVESADASAANSFKTAELNDIYNRSTLQVDSDYEYNVVKFECMTDIDSISSFAIKRSGQTFSLYLNGDSVETLSLTKDIEKAYLISYRRYDAKINEVID